MELIAIATFLTFANITGATAAGDLVDQFQPENQGVVTIEDVVTVETSEKPTSLLEAMQLKSGSSQALTVK